MKDKKARELLKELALKLEYVADFDTMEIGKHSILGMDMLSANDKINSLGNELIDLKANIGLERKMLYDFLNVAKVHQEAKNIPEKTVLVKKLVKRIRNRTQKRRK